MNAGLEHVTAVILAGGLGTRLQALYPDLPKPLVPVCGKPFVEWVARYLHRQGVRRAIVSCGYKAQLITAHFERQPVTGLTVQCVTEANPMGTAGGFLEAAAHAGHEPAAWLVVNGDSLVLADLNAAAAPLGHPEVQGVVVGVAVPDTSRYGRIAHDDTGRLLRFEEKQPGRGVINAGLYFFKPAAVARFAARRPLSFETEVFPDLLARQVRLDVSVTATPFLDIGTPESVAQADAFIRQHRSLLS